MAAVREVPHSSLVIKQLTALTFILISSISTGAKPVFSNLNKWAASRGRAAVIREWGQINNHSRKLIVDNWVESGDITKEYGNRLLRRL
jgi:hypothetical protein